MAERKLDAKRVTAALLAGQLDGDVFDILTAIRARIEAGAVPVYWRITFEDLDITEENLTVAEGKHVERIAKASVRVLAPAGSAENISAYVTAALMTRRELSETDARAVVDGTSLKSLFGAVSEYRGDDRPKDGGGSPN